jgi:hypothetical protein
MFLFKSLASLVWGGEKQDLLQVSGSFYDHHRNSWRCLFPNCSATISKGTEKFTYNVVICRVFDEGESPESDSDTPQKFQFSVSEKMEVTKTQGPLDSIALSWRDTASNNRFLLEFDNKGNVNQMSDLFHLTLRQCMYEHKYQRSHTEASDRELEEIGRAPVNQPASEYIPSKPSPATSSPAKPPAPTSVQTLEGALSSLSISNTVSPSTPAGPSTATTSPPSTPSKPAQQPTPTSPAAVQSPAKPAIPPSPIAALAGEPRCQVVGDLYLFDDQSQVFNIQEKGVAVTLNATGNNKNTFNFILYVLKNDKLIFAQDVGNEMHMFFNKEQQSIIWVYSQAKLVWTWSVVFPNAVTDQTFKEAFAVALWEHNCGSPFGALKEDEKLWVLGGFKDDVPAEPDDGMKEPDMLDFERQEPEKIAVSSAGAKTYENDDTDEEETDSSTDDESEEEAPARAQKVTSPKGPRNSLLAVGYRTDRSFVVRGSQIGVFKTQDNKLQHATTIDTLKTPGGDLFSPKKIMLHQEDNSMLMLNPGQTKKMYRMDLNRPDIVEEWKASDNWIVNDIIPETKYAQTTGTSTFVGMNNLGFFLVDPRLRGQKMVDAQSYFYDGKSRPDLKCAATTGSGQMVIGTKKGDIRLFSQNALDPSKKDALARKPRAKTTLPGFGDPIIGIDVTEDGSWILATCETYLLVIPTTMQDGTSGFEAPMGKQKPVPRRLQLKREHLSIVGGKVKFTPAHFNTGADQERSIVTSSGAFIITWNFRKVKQNKLQEYQIKKYNQVIIADQFKYNQDSNIIVTMPDDVALARKVVKKWPQ